MKISATFLAEEFFFRIHRMTMRTFDLSISFFIADLKPTIENLIDDKSDQRKDG